MKFTLKEYKIAKTKSYIKTNNLFFFFTGTYRNSNEWITVDQNLQNMNFDYYKIFNKTSKKTLKNSILKSFIPAINSITFLTELIINSKEVKKQTLLNSFEPLLFTILAIKLNNKIYSTYQLKKIFSCNYTENKLLFFQFGVTNLKIVLKKNCILKSK